jgi:hypothetical protein
MTARVREPLAHADVVLEGFLALDAPEGFRAELIRPPTGTTRTPSRWS